MKQQVILIGFVFALLTAYSQENNSAATVAVADTTAKVDTTAKKEYCPHRIWINAGMAYSNNIYRRLDNIQQKYSFGNVLELGYSYFFHPNMGVGLGVGISKISAKALLGNGGFIVVNEEGYITDGNTDPAAKAYDMFFECKKFAEKQNIWAIEVPLTFQFEMKMGEAKRNGIFASLGVKGYFPISARTNFAGGDLSFSGYDPYLNCVWPKDMPVHFEPASMGENYAKTKLRPSVDLIADFGGLFGLTKTTDFYLGIYGSYGFLNILPKDKVTYVQKENSNNPTVEGMLNSNTFEAYNLAYPDNKISEKWNLVNAGLKLGLRFKPCTQRKQSLREDKRDFFEQYGQEVERKKAKDKEEPRKPRKDKEDDGGNKDDGDKDGGGKGKKGGEQVYIVPIYIDKDGRVSYPNDGDRTKEDYLSYLDPEKDKDVIDLIDALTKARIFFDLDKDVPNNPKLANREIDRAVTILKSNPDLKIIIDGYTCRLGTQPHNEDLAQRRANKIRTMFLEKGANSSQIETETFTIENYPKEVAKTFHSLEEARTVIFRIVKKR